MQTVLVTGGDGFTGIYLTELLAAEAGMRVFRSSLTGDRANDSIACDLTDFTQAKALIERTCPDYVVHLAGLTFVGHPNPLEFYRINVLGTENLLRALIASKNHPKKMIVAGSANVYGASARPVIPEDVCPAPVNHYASSKLAQEHLARTYFEEFPIIVTRPFNYTGRGQDEKFVIPKIVSHFRAGAAEIALGNIDVKRDFSDVRDVARMYRRLLTCDKRSTEVNLCSGTAHSIRAIISILEDIAGYSITVKQDPEFLRRNEIESLRGDTSRLEALMGEFDRTPLAKTLEWMYGCE